MVEYRFACDTEATLQPVIRRPHSGRWVFFSKFAMFRSILTTFSHSSHGVRAKLLAIYGFLIAINALGWAWALVAFRQYPVLLGSALLAYSFGLRHAVDADHIAAIDNVTRKLMQEKKRPLALGLFFSLGHSSVVMAASVLVAFAATSLQGRFDSMKDIGGVIGTLVSASFLLLIALMNLVILRSIWRAWRRVKMGATYVESDFDLLLADRGFLARIFRPIFRVVSRSWHMFPLGFLFGLGFDTATEVGLLGMSATQTARGMSPWSVMIFPLLFGAGMSLIDTLDGHLMLGAYGWAYMKPIRKIYYNLSITLVSVLVAVLVGSIEVMGLLANRLQLDGAFWDLIASLNDNFGMLGYLIIGVFVFSWAISVMVYRVRNIDHIQVKTAPN